MRKSHIHIQLGSNILWNKVKREIRKRNEREEEGGEKREKIKDDKKVERRGK